MNLKDLKKWNQLSSDLILPGQKLNISSQEEKSEEKQYTVQLGDTLSKIAKEFGVTVSDLQKRNNLKSDLIIAGQTIAINGEAGGCCCSACETRVRAKTKRSACQRAKGNHSDSNCVYGK